jgi:hypothetical protein
MCNWKVILAVITLTGCKKPYEPPVKAAPGGYLVVEGVVNPGSDSTIIKLSHTVSISNRVTANPVLGATLTVESDRHSFYPLTEAGNGSYISTGLALDNSRTYRLNIRTKDNKQYQSDFEPVIITPPIDSIGFNIVTVPDTGIQIYANTHDATNMLHYFRWDYNENWEFSAKYVSYFISNGLVLLERTPAQYISNCYTSDISSDIVLGSSAKLNQNLIFQQPITFILSGSEKIESRYRAVIRQYALTSDAFKFWTNLKKNTEQLGSIFDALPSEIPGNIHCITNPAEPVIGYLSVSTVQSKIKFIYSSQLPTWTPNYPYSCSLDTAGTSGPNYNNLVLYPDIYFATDPIGPILAPVGYYYTSRACADCTIRGSLTPPPYWK